MPTINDVSLVTIDNIHIAIPDFISQNNILISGYEDMVDVVLRMIQSHIFINIDKDLLRSFLEDFAYMYCPGDDINKDRVVSMLEASDDEDDDDDELLHTIGDAPEINK